MKYLGLVKRGRERNRSDGGGEDDAEGCDGYVLKGGDVPSYVVAR